MTKTERRVVRAAEPDADTPALEGPYATSAELGKELGMTDDEARAFQAKMERAAGATFSVLPVESPKEPRISRYFLMENDFGCLQLLLNLLRTEQHKLNDPRWKDIDDWAVNLLKKEHE